MSARTRPIACASLRVGMMTETRNEAQAIGRVLADIPAEVVDEVIVVDNHSSDETPAIAARMGARVISEARRGYGRACLTGLACARSEERRVGKECGFERWVVE